MTAGVDAFSSGISREQAADQDVDLSVQGCSCHNPQVAPDVIGNVDVPSRFEPGQTYTLNITWTGGPEPAGLGSNNGGFNLLATAGEFAPPEGDAAGWVQVVGEGNEVTHTIAGEQQTIRNFTVLWTAPEEVEPVMFVLTVNSVDGNGAPDPTDLWNQFVVVTQPTEAEAAIEGFLGGAPDEGVEINEIGVHYLAYWVGVISFAVLFVMYGLTFFLFKFNESGHTTDHKDRAK